MMSFKNYKKCQDARVLEKWGVLEIPCQSDKISRRIDNEREFRH
jgi:hypothetical protein